MSLSTECAAALLSFRYASIFIYFLCFRIGSGKQVASVIVDDGKDQDDEDDTFVVEDPHAIQNDVDLVSSHQLVCLPLICSNFL